MVSSLKPLVENIDKSKVICHILNKIFNLLHRKMDLIVGIYRSKIILGKYSDYKD